MCRTRPPAYVDSAIRKPLSPGPMGRVWFHWNFPFSLASASIQGPTPLLGEGVTGICRSILWSQSLLLPLGGFQGSKLFPQLVHQAQTEPSPQSTAGFCLAMGAFAALSLRLHPPSRDCLLCNLLPLLTPSVRGNPQPILHWNHWCPPKPSGFLGNSWQAHPPERQEASLRTWSLPHSLCQPVLLVTVSSHPAD